ncbi:MAG: Holliday junction branch migration protein RuvA [Anaerolineae bacterium]|nr:Holliday junction branch migration protein RuvA [Anaerolineae bacterium]MDW8070769.1 Holliday junction branch migration protein RuvA [Anaerolineae bacterium]
MIGRIRGEVIEKREGALLLDVNGIGFIVHVPADLLDAIDGGSVTLYTHLQVRQDELTLYGFADRESWQLFRTLLSVPGIGPRVALSILSHVPAEMLRRAVMREEIALLARVPGIGPKKARQLVFALRDKIGTEEVGMVGAPISDADSEVIAALTALGYSAAEAHAALRALPPEVRDQPVEERVRLALSSLARW